MIKPILCPICQKPALDSSASPFCSGRCRKVDLMRWCDGRYAITETLSPDSAALQSLMMSEEEEDGLLSGQ